MFAINKSINYLSFQSKNMYYLIADLYCCFVRRALFPEEMGNWYFTSTKRTKKCKFQNFKIVLFKWCKTSFEREFTSHIHRKKYRNNLLQNFGLNSFMIHFLIVTFHYNFEWKKITQNCTFIARRCLSIFIFS